jgi:hypothetical protein
MERKTQTGDGFRSAVKILQGMVRPEPEFVREEEFDSGWNEALVKAITNLKAAAEGADANPLNTESWEEG